MTRVRGDRGSLAPIVPVVALVLLLLGGLVIDASRLLNARGRAVAYAEEAARAGAGAIEPGQSVLELDQAEVAARVRAYCDDVLADDTQSGGVLECAFRPPLQPVSATDRRLLVVRVFVRLEIPASLLGIVGVDVLRASGDGQARAFEGVDPRDVDSSPPPVDVPDPVDLPEAPPGVEVPVLPEPPPLPDPLPSPSPSASPSASPGPDPSPVASPVPVPSPSPS